MQELKQTLTIEITPEELNRTIENAVRVAVAETVERVVADSIKQLGYYMKDEIQDCFISARKAAKLLDCTVRTLNNYPELKKYRKGGMVKYRKSDVMGFLKAWQPKKGRCVR